MTTAFMTEIPKSCPKCGAPTSTRRSQRDNSFYAYCSSAPHCNWIGIIPEDQVMRSLNQPTLFDTQPQEEPHAA